MEDANKLPEKREKINSLYAKLELNPGWKKLIIKILLEC